MRGRERQIHLSPSELENIRNHLKTRGLDLTERKRVLAVYLRATDVPRESVLERLSISPKTLWNYLERYERGGLPALKPTKKTD